MIYVGFSEFLNSRRDTVKALVNELKANFEFVSVAGSDIQAKAIQVNKNTSTISQGNETECGFVVKMSNGGAFFEYSLDDIDSDVKALAEKIVNAFNFSMSAEEISDIHLSDEPLVKSFDRESDIEKFSDNDILSFCDGLCHDILNKDEHFLNVTVNVGVYEVSKLFISINRELDQHYTWVNGRIRAVYNENGKNVAVREDAYDKSVAPVLEKLPALTDHLIHKAHMLTLAKPVVPGVYDVITDPSITGLIAHEAFGHGVEMDQFVKDRALAKSYVGDYVASPIVNMKDGAGSALSVASYFFDDDGVLAGDTQIIKDGILLTGISDKGSATQLGTVPTGNGRRESTRRKVYTRMTNTFFEKGTDKLEDMIKSVKHGYMLFETNNGMEDPKNWAIQCVAEYGIEIIDGKLTENYVSPVVMSGYVPDLLKSISMVSDDFSVIGAGMCGKGYKEWVRVSDGGPALKARVKLG